MVKLKKDIIEIGDIEEYLVKESDFAFELKIIQDISRKQFEIEHGGTYIDPITNINRQFDIRAYKKIPWQGGFNIDLLYYFAIECKNIRENYPLVILRTKCSESESYIYVVSNDNHKSFSGQNYDFSQREQPNFIKEVKNNGIYSRQEFVGRSCAQVGKTLDGGITSSDSEIYGKWSQAVNSSYDLIKKSHENCNSGIGLNISIITPCLVIPDERLWIVDYDSKGNIINGPHKDNSSNFYIDKEYKIIDHFSKEKIFKIPHLKICTQSGFVDFIDNINDMCWTLPESLRELK